MVNCNCSYAAVVMIIITHYSFTRIQVFCHLTPALPCFKLYSQQCFLLWYCQTVQLYCSFGWQSVYTITRSQRGKWKIWYFVTFLYMNYINDFEFILQSTIYKKSWISLCYLWVTLMHCFTRLFRYIVSKFAHSSP